jgi:hypothetical protein
MAAICTHSASYRWSPSFLKLKFSNFNDNFDVGFFHPYECLMATTSLVRRLLPYLKSLNNNTELDVRTGSEYNLYPFSLSFVGEYISCWTEMSG